MRDTIKPDEKRQISKAWQGDLASFNARVLSDRNLIKLRRDAEKRGNWRLREVCLKEETRRLSYEQN